MKVEKKSQKFGSQDQTRRPSYSFNDSDDAAFHAFAPPTSLSPLTRDQWQRTRARSLEDEFEASFYYWRHDAMKIQWNTFGIKDTSQYDILDVPLGDVLKKHLSDQTKYGYLFKIATHSRAGLASCGTSAYSERMASAGGIVSTKHNVSLSSEEIEMRIPIRMNKSFIDAVGSRYEMVVGHQKK